MRGDRDLARAASDLAIRLPEELGPLAELAYNYWWSWQVGGEDVFRAVDPHRWERAGGNPVRLLTEASPAALAQAANDAGLVRRAAELRDELGRLAGAAAADPRRRVAFLCTEFAVHRSLPVYAGGLGVLAGDLLKEASDRDVPMVGVGLLYRQGYFRQRIDTTGWQHEYWTDVDPDRLPAALVTDDAGAPVTVSVVIRGRPVTAQIWRVDVGRVPLLLLDAERPENDPVDRWIGARLYVGDRRIRLEQYALLGIGGVRALRALGIDPSAIHLNEGHVALSALEIIRERIEAGSSFPDALDVARSLHVFTTHTPVAAGNEAYTADEVLAALGRGPAALAVDSKELLGLGRVRPDDADEPFGLTPFGIRVSRTTNGVSRRHGEVAREMWRPLFSDRPDVPIDAVTNGVHLTTWIAGPMRELIERRLGPGWEERAADPATWSPIDDVPDEELWEVRTRLRRRLVERVRARLARERLARGEPLEYAEGASHAFDAGVLTIGFARRAALYKRLYLLSYDPGRALRLIDSPQPLQLVLAGKPHPSDEEAKRMVQAFFGLRWAPHVAERVAYLEDYDLEVAALLVAGCDVWLNVPRAPLEASGTSGMKAAVNGGLNVSVLDGWWAEAYDGRNGWAIEAHAGGDAAAQDALDASRLYEILENEVVPLFYERDASGVPRGWMARVKASMRTLAPSFSATRMLDDYVRRIYPDEIRERRP